MKGEIERHVRKGPVLSFDDTVTECFVVTDASGRRKLKQARLWVFVNPEVRGVVFRFTTGRGADDLATILSTPKPLTSVKVLSSDGLAVNRPLPVFRLTHLHERPVVGHLVRVDST